MASWGSMLSKEDRNSYQEKIRRLEEMLRKEEKKLEEIAETPNPRH